MNRLKNIVLLLSFLVFQLGYGQQCSLSTLADDLVDASEDFKEILNSSSGFDAYRVLSLAEEDKVVRVGKDALTDVSDYLVSSTKSIDDLVDEIKRIGGYNTWKFRIGRVKHPNWVQVDDITTKVLAKEPHVLKVETKADGTFYPKSKTIDGRTFNMEGFKGCHSENALKEYIQAHGGTYAVKNKSVGQGGVYEGQPIIYINDKEYVKINGRFVEYESGKLGGTSSFFPEEWSNTKIKQEVEHAIKNNHGLAPDGSNSYFGYSQDGLVEIRFYLNNDGGIGSYFPKKI